MAHSAVASVLILSLISQIEGFPNGAPPSACSSMTPGHGVATQQSSSPFITTSTKGEIALPGTSVQLELRPQNGDTPFRGYFVMAFDRNDDSKPIGTFQEPRDGKLIDCSGGMQNAVTHINNSDKKSVIIEWMPPPNYSGQVVFKTTFVQNKMTFWVKTESKVVSVVTETQGSPRMVPKPAGSSASQVNYILGNLVSLFLMAISVL
ncbi:putative defense protein [Daphnia carinata]|uniref:putative defense protein n=1 Tax=Daphnia carinata TaxID=120202 RepID=UPI00257CD0CB|nr:putative defense protein [Daphnia carinata]